MRDTPEMLTKPILGIVLGLALSLSTAPAQEPAAVFNASLVVKANQPGAVINRNIYGQFSEHLGHCIYEGVWVGEDSPIPNTRGIRNDVVAALKKLKVPVLRWPGGCFADEYHWKDGIGPRDQRPSMINTHWGGVVENNAFGTHEFMDFCAQIGAAALFLRQRRQRLRAGNDGMGRIRDLRRQIAHGQSAPEKRTRSTVENALLRRRQRKLGLRREHDAGVLRRQFPPLQHLRQRLPRQQDLPHRLRGQRGGLPLDGGADEQRRAADERPFAALLHLRHGARQPVRPRSFPRAIGCSTLRNAARIEELVTNHSAIMDRYDPQKRVGLIVDEWGAWYAVEPGSNPGFLYQQNTLRDALVAGLTLNIFNHHCDRVKMANIAQIDQRAPGHDPDRQGEDVIDSNLSRLRNVHRPSGRHPAAVRSGVPDYRLGDEAIPALTASASRDNDGKVHISLTNADPHRAANLSCQLDGMTAKTVTGRVLTAPAINSHNTFDAPDTVQPQPLAGATVEGGKVSVTLPPKSSSCWKCSESHSGRREPRMDTVCKPDPDANKIAQTPVFTMEIRHYSPLFFTTGTNFH